MTRLFYTATVNAHELSQVAQLARNEGSSEEPDYAKPFKLECEAGVIDVYGMPSPNFADFDGDGDLDLLCGEFVDKLTYFENVGTRDEPRYAKGKFLKIGNELLKIDCCMFVPVAIDCDRDGDFDLIIGQEDGRVMFCEHSGLTEDGLAFFSVPKFVKQEAAHVSDLARLRVLRAQIEVPAVEGDDGLAARAVLAILGQMIFRPRHDADLLENPKTVCTVFKAWETPRCRTSTGNRNSYFGKT